MKELRKQNSLMWKIFKILNLNTKFLSDFKSSQIITLKAVTTDQSIPNPCDHSIKKSLIGAMINGLIGVLRFAFTKQKFVFCIKAQNYVLLLFIAWKISSQCSVSRPFWSFSGFCWFILTVVCNIENSFLPWYMAYVYIYGTH